MTRRIRNVVVGALIAVAVWVVWSFVRHAILDGSLVFENVGRSIPAALLGAIAGYFITRRPPTASETAAISTLEPTLSIDKPSMPASDDLPFRGVGVDKSG
jgi:hypothetical protein